MSEIMSELPYIDPKIEHLGVSQLRQMDGKSIRSKNGKALLIQDHNEPIAVLLSYEQYRPPRKNEGSDEHDGNVHRRRRG